MVFQSPQASQRPCQRVVTPPQAWQTKEERDLANCLPDACSEKARVLVPFPQRLKSVHRWRREWMSAYAGMTRAINAYRVRSSKNK
jgi:hypothetical protein